MKTPKLNLTTRDYKVLQALEKWGVLGLGQLYGITVEMGADIPTRVGRFFNETARRDYGRWLAQRLTALAKGGLIQDHYFLNHPKIFTLDEAGHAKLQSESKAALTGFRGSISGELVNHEVHVAAVGLVLTEIFHLTARTERERYVWTSNRGRRPAPVRAVSDLWIPDTQPKAIEVELTQKSESRYREIWEAYALRLPDNAVVLYFTGWPDGVRRILHLARQFRAPFIFACDLRAFRDSYGTAPFLGIEDGQILYIGSLPAIPKAGAAPRRVPSPSLPARQDVSAGGRLGDGPFATPPQRAAAPIPHQDGVVRDQFVPPPESRACPRPHPLSSPSPSPEGDWRTGA